MLFKITVDPEKAKLLEFSEETSKKLDAISEAVCNFCGKEGPTFFSMWVQWEQKGITFELCKECTLKHMSASWWMIQGYKQAKKIYPWMNFDEPKKPVLEIGDYKIEDSGGVSDDK